MPTEKYFDDPELGKVIIRYSARARNYSIRINGGQIRATMPARGSEEKMLAFILSNREKLKAALRKYPAQGKLDESTAWQATTFQVKILRSERENFQLSLRDGILYIACPQETDFDDEEVQILLRKMIASALRHEAKRLLPRRLAELARQHGFSFSGVKINNSRTHWGSCTSHRSINLSLSLMTLPWHLIDYVLLHELCHTREMNHSERFWQLMDQVTQGKAKALREELKDFRIFASS